MLDPDEFIAFEDWRAEKIAGIQDLSVEAFNREREALALAWEAGVREAHNGNSTVLEALLQKNPHRSYGMTGHTTKRITS